MTNIKVNIGGNEYPCRPTMGAMLRFKRETGRDITEMHNDVVDMVTYLWCCVASACKADGVAFDYDLLDFADCVAPDEVQRWTAAINADAKPEGEGGGVKKN